MSQNIVSRMDAEVNPRFVRPAPIVEPTLAEQFAQGKRNYFHGRPLAACVTDEQTRGWLAAEARCEDAYWAGMMAQASVQEMN